MQLMSGQAFKHTRGHCYFSTRTEQSGLTALAGAVFFLGKSQDMHLSLDFSVGVC